MKPLHAQVLPKEAHQTLLPLQIHHDPVTRKIRILRQIRTMLIPKIQQVQMHQTKV